VLDVAAHRPTIQGHALVGEILLEPKVRRARPELRCDHARDRRGMQQRAWKQGQWARRRPHGGLIANYDLVLGDPLDQHSEATALEHQLVAVFEPDPSTALGLEVVVEDLHRAAR